MINLAFQKPDRFTETLINHIVELELTTALFS